MKMLKMLSIALFLVFFGSSAMIEAQKKCPAGQEHAPGSGKCCFPCKKGKHNNLNCVCKINCNNSQIQDKNGMCHDKPSAPILVPINNPSSPNQPASILNNMLWDDIIVVFNDPNNSKMSLSANNGDQSNAPTITVPEGATSVTITDQDCNAVSNNGPASVSLGISATGNTYVVAYTQNGQNLIVQLLDDCRNGKTGLC